MTWYEDWVEVIDDQGRPVIMPYKRALKLYEKRAAADDAALGIHRSRIPVEVVLLPEHPNASACLYLAEAVTNVARNLPFAFETEEERIWIRCVQNYWNAKGLALGQRLYPVPIPDPLASDGFIRTEMLPKVSADNLELDVAAEESWYRLLEAGEVDIRASADQEGLNYPFNNAEDLFVETLRIGFEFELTQGMLCPCPPNWNRKKHRDHYRSWLKFLSDHFDGQPQEAEYEQVLRRMSWKGYALLTLRKLKRKKGFGQLWKQYIKAHRPLIQFIDNAVDWDDGIPYQARETNDRRSRSRMELSAKIDPDGFFSWSKRAASKGG